MHTHRKVLAALLAVGVVVAPVVGAGPASALVGGQACSQPGAHALGEDGRWVVCMRFDRLRWSTVDVTPQRDVVRRLFRAALRRDGDPGGLDYWTWVHLNGVGFAALAEAFTATPEFQSTYGALSDTDFVRLVYRNVLAREPDPGGLEHWRRVIAERRATRGAVLLAFSESTEFRALTGIGAGQASLVASTPVTVRGVGPVVAGMTLGQAERAAGVTFDLQALNDFGRSCYYATPRGQADLSLIVVAPGDSPVGDPRSGVIGRVSLHEGARRTGTGVGIGSTEAQVYAAYPGRVTSEPHLYVEGGHYLVVTPAGPLNLGYRIVFFTDGERVTDVHAGLFNIAGAVEGCA